MRNLDYVSTLFRLIWKRINKNGTHRKGDFRAVVLKKMRRTKFWGGADRK